MMNGALVEGLVTLWSVTMKSELYRDTYHKVHFWHLKNKDGFLSGDAAQFEERGPYVYREEAEKIDVTFVSHTAQFYVWRTQSYQPDLTMQECGRICSKHDQITLINPDYLARVSAFGDDLSYTLHHLPYQFQDTLATITYLHGNEDGMDHSLRLFARADDPFDKWRTALQFPRRFEQLSFASWLHVGDTDVKRTVIGHRGGTRDHSLKETHALYEALLNEDILGNAYLRDIRGSRRNQCDYSINNKTMKYKNITYKLPIPTSTDHNGTGTIPKTCGLLHALKLYNSSSASIVLDDMKNLSRIIAQFLCTDPARSCLELPDDVHIQKAYIVVISDYIFQHLPKLVHYKSVILQGEGLVSTKSQTDWSLGYTLPNQTIADRVSSEFVPGILEHFEDEESVRRFSKHVTLTNCYDGIDAETNFMWLGFDRQRASSDAQFPFATLEARTLRSRFRNFPPVKNLSACVLYTLPESSYDVFFPPFWRKLPFGKDGQLPSIKGVPLERLTLNSSAMEMDGIFISEADGLQEMIGANGYLSWTSLPHFLFSDPILPSSYNMEPDEEVHTSFIDVELRSGDVWRDVYRHQHNVGVTPSYVQVLRQLGCPVMADSSPLPVYWVETASTFNSLGILDYTSRIEHLMNTSCGGLIGLSAVAGIVILFGFLAATVTIRGGRIAPIMVEEGSVLPP